ncbi:MAG TPA: carotenoid biosynthesis protein [Blastocatellia bacterium]|nr:carotenoid biosynthesis protein [Blastocatellia bacterium]
MTIRNLTLALLSIAYLVMWFGGVVSHAFLGGPPEDAGWTAPVFLLLAGLLVIVGGSSSNFPALLIAAALGFAAEVVGVRHEFLFGDYEYTGILRPHLFGVPLVMASAWMVLFAYVKGMASFFDLPRWLKVAAASSWMTAIDFVIDPMAAGPLNYWRWQDAGAYYGIPARNFVGWFAVSLIIFGLTEALNGRRWRPDLWACCVGLSIIVFFTVIAFAHGLALAGAIGLALCGAHLSAFRYREQPAAG